MRPCHLLLFTLSATVGLAAVPAVAAPGEIVKQFPTPGCCPTGLTFDGESLWLADRETDVLYRIDPKDGHVIDSFPAPGFKVEGLTSEGKMLWVLDTEDHKALKLDPKTGIVEKQITVSSSSPQGLAFDGKHLWVADRKPHRLCQISTEDGTTIREIPSPSADPHGLTYDGRYLWVSDRTDDMITMVHPQSGDVIVALPSPSKFPRGLAFDGEFLWNVDYQTDTLYQIRRQSPETQLQTEGKKETLEFVHQVRNYGPGVLVSLDVYLAVPHDLPSQTLLGPLTFTPEPKEFVTDKWGQKVAHYHYENVPASQFVTASWKAEVELYKTRSFLFPEKVGSLSDIPTEIKDCYLCDGSKYWINDPYIQKTAKDVVGDETNCYWIARKLFEHVIKKMHYERTGGWNVAPTVLKRGSGSCSEYSFAYIALCCAAGLPARYVGSVVIRGDDASTDDGIFHRWPEVYLPNYGWVPLDPSSIRGESDSPATKAAVIGYRDNRYLITTIGGGGSEYLEWDYNSNATWRSKGPCKVETERFGEWSPLGESQPDRPADGPEASSPRPFDFEEASRDVPNPREIWPIVKQFTVPLDFKVLSDEVVPSDTDPSQKLRKVTAHFFSQELAGKKWGHLCVIFLPEDDRRNLTPERKGKVVIVGSPPRDYFPVHVAKYGEPIAARTGYPTMVLSNPGEYPDGSDIEHDIRILNTLRKHTGQNYYNMNCQLAVVYIRAMDALEQFLGLNGLKAVVGGHSKRGRGATVAAAMDPRVASVIIMGNEGVYATDRIEWHLSFHHAFFQDQVSVPVFYLGATNEDGYKMFNVNIMQERLKRPMTIEMIPNYCHSNFSEIQYMDFMMWVAHVFDGRPITQISDVSHDRQPGCTVFRAKLHGDAKIQIVRAWYVYSDDPAWRDLMWYHLLMNKAGDHYEAVLPGKIPDAFMVEVGDIAEGIPGYVSSLPYKLTDAAVIERRSRGSRPRLWEPAE